MILRRVLIALALVALTSACAMQPMRAVNAAFSDPALAGTRFGLVVMTLEGKELIAINPDNRYIPASNTKLFTTAAVFHRMSGLDRPDAASGASLHVAAPADGSPPSLFLVGHGDATLSDRPGCVINCLRQLADAVVARGVTTITDIVGDDRAFPDERWGPGWSWNNLQTRSGTGVSALTVNDNELTFDAGPGDMLEAEVKAAWRAGDAFHPLINDTATSPAAADAKANLGVERLPGAQSVRLYGAIPLGLAPFPVTMGVEDPALVAAWRLRQLLEARGVAVTGEIRAVHRPLILQDDPKFRGDAAAPAPFFQMEEIARLIPGPLRDDLRLTNKVSQNLHAEILLRRLGQIKGGGSTADGLAIVEEMLTGIGIPRTGFDFSDGSGMSTYNRVSPRTTAAFLRWTAQQTWGATFRGTLPVGGVDGTLARRFKDTPLEGRIFAKTGSLNAVNALAGFMTTASGRTLVFAAYANDYPSTVSTATTAIDAALVAIAKAN